MLYMIGSAKARHKHAFFLNSRLLNIYNLLSQVHHPAMFQPHNVVIEMLYYDKHLTV